jgi:hypothetical protein
LTGKVPFGLRRWLNHSATGGGPVSSRRSRPFDEESIPPIPLRTDRVVGAQRNCKGCQDTNAHDDWNQSARGERPLQRLDRSYAEILQEVRVAQTGVQVLLAFLLTLAFTPKFATLNHTQLILYVATLILGAAATALLMAPAPFHRIVFRHRLKHHLVTAANRFALYGLATLLLAKGCAIMLILDVVLGPQPAHWITGAVVSWFVLFWFALPMWCRHRHRPRR